MKVSASITILATICTNLSFIAAVSVLDCQAAVKKSPRTTRARAFTPKAAQRNQQILCSGTDDTSAVQNALRTTNGRLFVGKSQICATSDLTIGQLIIEPGGLLKPLPGHTITITGAFVAGTYQTFTGATAGEGTISFRGNKTVNTVNAAWWGALPARDPDQAKDDTAALQAAFSSGAPKILIPDGHYMIDGTKPQPGYKRFGLNLVSDTEVLMSPNTYLHLKNNSSVGYNLLVGWKVSNVIVRGGNLIGDNQTNSRKPNENPSGYGLALYGVTNVSIYNLTSQDMYADGFMIAYDDDEASKSHPESENVHLLNCIGYRNYRQGASVVGARSGSIEGGKFYGTKGSSPEAGIDLEPNVGIHGQDGGSVISNFKIVGVTANQNAGAGIAIVGPAGPITNVDVIRNHVESNGDQGVVFRGASNGNIVGNVVTKNARNGISVYHSAQVEVRENTCEQNGQDGIIIQNPSGYATHHVKVTANTTNANRGDGIGIYGFAGKIVNDVLINLNTSSDNGAAGILVRFAVNVVVDENKVFGNSQTLDEQSDNIELTNADNCSISDNWVRRGEGARQPRYGINVASGTGNLVRNNDLLNAGKTQPINDGATRSNVFGNRVSVAPGKKPRLMDYRKAARTKLHSGPR